jgi:glycosyltransferase involved in cell wall biosynthesis
MASITVGVPTYNRCDLLQTCLECLAAQTFGDFEVLIYDNASTDGTAKIGQAWAARDRRFRYFRQREKVDVSRNFREALDAADSDYFMWRADDDLSVPDFLEVLHGLLQGANSAQLAVGAVKSIDERKMREIHHPVPERIDEPRVLRIRRMLFESHPAWFYGLWRREALAEIVGSLWPRYPIAWAADHLTLFGPILDEAVLCTNQTEFVQGSSEVRVSSVRPSARASLEIRNTFARRCREMIDGRDFSATERMLLRQMTFFYANKRVCRMAKLARMFLRERFA